MPRTFRFDGRTIPYEHGDTLASALHRAGVRVLSRSMKYHRPRGLYCMAGSCASCYVEVDGVPNVAACTTRAAAGARVRSQNRIGSARFDVLGVVDKVYPKGFHPHDSFTKPRIVNAAFQHAVRFMSGVGRAPWQPADRSPRRHKLHISELVIGAGRQGLERVLASKAKDVLLVDELEALGGSQQWDPTRTEEAALVAKVERQEHVRTWTDAVAFGIYGDVVAVRRGEDLWEVTADRITIAPGSHDAWPLFTNNDLPGVLSLHGAKRLWYQHDVLPGKRIVAHGKPLPKAFADTLEEAGARVVASGQVTRVSGTGSVARAHVDGHGVRCDAVVCNLPGVKRVELFQQAGCSLRCDASGLAPITTADGATDRPGIYAAFSTADAPAPAPASPPEVAA